MPRRALADLAAFALRRRLVGAAPACRRQRAPDKSIGRPTPLFMAEAAGRDHEVDSVAGEKHSGLAVFVGNSRFASIADDRASPTTRHGARSGSNIASHIGICLDDRVQGEMPGRILKRWLRGMIVGDVIVRGLHRCAREIIRDKCARSVCLRLAMRYELLCARRCSAVAAERRSASISDVLGLGCLAPRRS